MDTSKAIQLKKSINHILDPHIKNLPFRRLEEQLRESFFMYRKQKYILRFGHTKCSLGVTHEDRVRAIPLTTKIHTGSDNLPNRYELTQLLFFRGRSGGGFLSWYWHTAQFELMEMSKTYFRSSTSTLESIPTPNDLATMHLPIHFERKLKEGIGVWISEAIESRKKVLLSLNDLQLQFPTAQKVLAQE